MKIIYISPYFDPRVASGANRRFNEIGKRFLRDYGDDFVLIVSKGCKPSWWTGKNLYEVDYRFNHLSKFKATREIGKILDTFPPSIVIIESVPIPFKALKKHVHFQVAYDFRYFTGDSKGFLYRLIFSGYLKRQWAQSEFMVTCSDFSISELEKYVGFAPEKVVKSYFGIDQNLFDTIGQQPEKKEYDIIYVGHFEKRKNHEPLLRAIAKVDKNLKTLLIGADNGMKSYLQNLAAELGLQHVLFDTINDDKKLWSLYRKSRLFAYPSIYEGFGIPLIEALSLGIPVVASDISVFREVGANLATFFDPHNPDDIGEKIRMTLKNPNMPSAAEIKAHLQKFLWENIYQKFDQDLKHFAAIKI